jgi:hypothetical protein
MAPVLNMRLAPSIIVGQRHASKSYKAYGSPKV